MDDVSSADSMKWVTINCGEKERRKIRRLSYPYPQASHINRALVEAARANPSLRYDGTAGDWTATSIATLMVPDYDGVVMLLGVPPVLLLRVETTKEDAYVEWITGLIAPYLITLDVTKERGGAGGRLPAPLPPLPYARPGLLLSPGSGRQWLAAKAAFATVSCVVPVNDLAALRDEVIALHQAHADPPAIGGHICAYFDREPSALDVLVDRVVRASGLWGPDREGDVRTVLNETVRAHRNGLDAVAVYPLIPLVEAALRPVAERLTGRGDGAGGLSFDQLSAIARHPTIGRGVLTRVLGSLGLAGYLGGYFYRSTRTIERSDDGHPVVPLAASQRHVAVHALVIGGERLDTIRCFLLLDQLAHLLEGA